MSEKVNLNKRSTLSFKNLAYLLLVSMTLHTITTQALTFKEYSQKPQLVVVIVIDQFRADFLARYQKDFKPASQKGFNYLMETGAYFAQSQYDILQAMTCPGHAMILTGSYPAQTGIQLNEWYDSQNRKRVYCADDAEFGLSPRKLKTTTWGDELKNTYKDSRVMTVALKDRSAIFLGGHRSDLSLWYDKKLNQWTTSKYYNEGALPDWLQKINEKQKNNIQLEKNDFASALEGTKATLDIALQILEKEKLGQIKKRAPDVLAVSFSNHDILGHQEGPDSENVKKLTLFEDEALSKIQKKIKDLNLSDNTILVLTADHGIPSVSENLVKQKITSGKFNYLEVIKKSNEVLTKEFGSSGERGWVEGVYAFHVYLNKEMIARKKLDPVKMQNLIKPLFQKLNGVYRVITRDEIEQNKIPYFDLEWFVRNSFVPEMTGDLVLVPEPFFAENHSLTVTHMTRWNYDTTVPLIFWGPKWFKSGVYAGSKIVDIAPTLSFMTGVIPPPKSSGRVLSEALK